MQPLLLPAVMPLPGLAQQVLSSTAVTLIITRQYRATMVHVIWMHHSHPA